jgi:hypothetical protein
VNFSTIAGINALTKSLKLSLYPNPSSGETNLKFTLNDPAAISLQVVDLLGKEIQPTTTYQMGAGDQNLVVNKDNKLAKGVYFVNLSVNGAKVSRKLLID